MPAQAVLRSPGCTALAHCLAGANTVLPLLPVVTQAASWHRVSMLGSWLWSFLLTLHSISQLQVVL